MPGVNSFLSGSSYLVHPPGEHDSYLACQGTHDSFPASDQRPYESATAGSVCNSAGKENKPTSFLECPLNMHASISSESQTPGSHQVNRATPVFLGYPHPDCGSHDSGLKDASSTQPPSASQLRVVIR
ncbi:hypothetical protein CI610_02836 [invertebrate metagenome]|uniref:Uncharacterized protein n=1 Tax=invertebrate metagenome TaxID=1711999 RepID=A0A2H9T4U8_9ZZZZ